MKSIYHTSSLFLFSALFCLPLCGTNINLKHVEYRSISLKVEYIELLLRSGEVSKARVMIEELLEHWRRTNEGDKDSRRNIFARVCYLDAFANYQIGDRQKALEAFERAIIFENENTVYFSPREVTRDFFVESTILLANLLQNSDELGRHPTILQGFRKYGSDGLVAVDIDGTGDVSFIALLRSNDLVSLQGEEEREFSIVVLCRRGLDGLYRATTTFVPWAKYHRLLTEKNEDGSTSIVLEKTGRIVPPKEGWVAHERIVLAPSEKGGPLVIMSRKTQEIPAPDESTSRR